MIIKEHARQEPIQNRSGIIILDTFWEKLAIILYSDWEPQSLSPYFHHIAIAITNGRLNDYYNYSYMCILEISAATVTADIASDSTSSASYTASIRSTANISTLATPPSTDARQEQDNDDGSNVGGIVAGCVVAFIVFVAIVVCLIIFLMWYRAKKKREYTTKPGIIAYTAVTTYIHIAT